MTPKLLLLIHDKTAPTDNEWQQVIAAVSDANAGGIRSIAISDGGAPTRAQQQLLRDKLQGRPAPTAVVCDVVAARFVISIIALFNAGIRGFSSTDWQKAVAWATGDEQARSALRVVITEIAAAYVGKFTLLEKIVQKRG